MMEFEYKGKHYIVYTIKEAEICVVYDTNTEVDEDDGQVYHLLKNVVDWFYYAPSEKDNIVEFAKERLDWLESEK